MNCEIFLRSYLKDREWCVFALRSINKFCRGFSGVTLIVADYDADGFKELERYTTADQLPVRLVTYPGNRPKAMLECMAQLCYADQFCPHADLILHTDSDCVFKRPVTPESFMTDGKPQLLIRTFESLRGQPPACWEAPTSAALGIPASHEVMARHPAVHWRMLYPSLRQRVKSIHNKDFHDYAVGFENKFPWGFAEFPALGMWALATMEGSYHIIDVSGVPEDEIGIKYKDKLYQGWTHFGAGADDQAAAHQQRRNFELIVS